MKNLYQLLSAIAICAIGFNSPSFGQLAADSVEMGASYANDIYYSMENGEVLSVSRTNWDIAFYTSAFSAGIIINEGNGVELRLYPGADTTGWGSVDTTGFSTWPVLYNSPEIWEEGAFDRSALGHPDYGWGVYNSVTHDVVGDSIYLIKFIDESVKKVWIERKISIQNIYMFKYADLDGSNEVSVTLDCKDYTDKNFVYYSMQTQEVLDREPASDTWDFLCTKYIAILEGNVPYPVTGVLMNNDVPANRFDEVGPDFVNWPSIPFDSTKVAIGYDWKYFDMGIFSYVVEDSIAFFVSNMNTDVYKLVFTSFDYTVGKFVFEKGLISPAGIGQTINNDRFTVYPNPASGSVTLETLNGFVPERISVMDLSGREVYSEQGTSQKMHLDLGNLPGGMYVIRLHGGSEQFIQKLMIQK